MADCKYIAHPRNDFSNQMIAAALSQACRGSGGEVTFYYKGKEMQGGYYVEHSLITRLKACAPDTRIKIDYYEQRGSSRNVEKYGIPPAKRSKKVRDVKKRLKEITSKKRDTSPAPAGLFTLCSFKTL